MGDGAIKIWVSAIPERGRANQAVLDRLGQVLGVGRGRMRVARGQRARLKIIEVEGMEQAELERRVERALGSGA